MSTDVLGFVWIHGINQSESDLRDMQDWILRHLRQFGLLDRFCQTDGTPMVWCAQWRSLGSFLGDLEDLSRHRTRREEATLDIQNTIRQAWTTLETYRYGTARTALLVCAHSMGQPLGLMALHGLQKDSTYPVRTSLLSVGGPLGNQDPVVRRFLHTGVDGSYWVRHLVPQKPTALFEWTDVWNPLDPVCCAPVLGYSAYPGACGTMFKVMGQPPILNPLERNVTKYHGMYFEYDEIWHEANAMLTRLQSP